MFNLSLPFTVPHCLRHKLYPCLIDKIMCTLLSLLSQNLYLSEETPLI